MLKNIFGYFNISRNEKCTNLIPYPVTLRQKETFRVSKFFKYFAITVSVVSLIHVSFDMFKTLILFKTENIHLFFTVFCKNISLYQFSIANMSYKLNKMHYTALLVRISVKNVQKLVGNYLKIE